MALGLGAHLERFDSPGHSVSKKTHSEVARREWEVNSLGLGSLSFSGSTHTLSVFSCTGVQLSAGFDSAGSFPFLKQFLPEFQAAPLSDRPHPHKVLAGSSLCPWLLTIESSGVPSTNLSSIVTHC